MSKIKKDFLSMSKQICNAYVCVPDTFKTFLPHVNKVCAQNNTTYYSSIVIFETTSVEQCVTLNGTCAGKAVTHVP